MPSDTETEQQHQGPGRHQARSRHVHRARGESGEITGSRYKAKVSAHSRSGRKARLARRGLPDGDLGEVGSSIIKMMMMMKLITMMASRSEEVFTVTRAASRRSSQRLRSLGDLGSQESVTVRTFAMEGHRVVNKGDVIRGSQAPASSSWSVQLTNCRVLQF